jgi:branched-chain amino acid transport system ATP-binding protein
MTNLLTLDGISAGYGAFAVLHHIHIDVRAGEVVALIGSNSAGKTTTLRCISGLLKPTTGKIVFEGTDITRRTPHQIVESGLVSVPEGRQLFPQLSVMDNLLVGGSNSRARKHRKDSLERVFALFPRLYERREQLAGSLSGGEQQMAALGRGLMALPRLVLLDEPSLGLSPLIVRQLFKTIADIRDQGITVLLVEQNVHSALKVADRAYVIENGRIEFSATAADMQSDPRIAESYFGLGAKEFI